MIVEVIVEVEAGVLILPRAAPLAIAPCRSSWGNLLGAFSAGEREATPVELCLVTRAEMSVGHSFGTYSAMSEELRTLVEVVSTRVGSTSRELCFGTCLSSGFANDFARDSDEMVSTDRSEAVLDSWIKSHYSQVSCDVDRRAKEYAERMLAENNHQRRVNEFLGRARDALSRTIRRLRVWRRMKRCGLSRIDVLPLVLEELAKCGHYANSAFGELFGEYTSKYAREWALGTTKAESMATTAYELGADLVRGMRDVVVWACKSAFFSCSRTFFSCLASTWSNSIPLDYLQETNATQPCQSQDCTFHDLASRSNVANETDILNVVKLALDVQSAGMMRNVAKDVQVNGRGRLIGGARGSTTSKTPIVEGVDDTMKKLVEELFDVDGKCVECSNNMRACRSFDSKSRHVASLHASRLPTFKLVIPTTTQSLDQVPLPASSDNSTPSILLGGCREMTRADEYANKLLANPGVWCYAIVALRVLAHSLGSMILSEASTSTNSQRDVDSSRLLRAVADVVHRLTIDVNQHHAMDVSHVVECLVAVSRRDKLRNRIGGATHVLCIQGVALEVLNMIIFGMDIPHVSCLSELKTHQQRDLVCGHHERVDATKTLRIEHGLTKALKQENDSVTVESALLLCLHTTSDTNQRVCVECTKEHAGIEQKRAMLREVVSVANVPPVLAVEIESFYQCSTQPGFPRTFNKPRICDFMNTKLNDTTYSLSSIVVHDGESEEGGHYYILVRGRGSAFVKLDDARTPSLVPVEEVESILTDPTNFSKASLLVYKLATPPSPPPADCIVIGGDANTPQPCKLWANVDEAQARNAFQHFLRFDADGLAKLDELATGRVFPTLDVRHRAGSVQWCAASRILNATSGEAAYLNDCIVNYALAAIQGIQSTMQCASSIVRHGSHAAKFMRNAHSAENNVLAEVNPANDYPVGTFSSPRFMFLTSFNVVFLEASKEWRVQLPDVAQTASTYCARPDLLELVLIPLSKGRHWFLAALRHDLKQCSWSLEIYDSLKGVSMAQPCSNKQLSSTMLSLLQTQVAVEGFVSKFASTWDMPCASQTDAVNCGLFTIAFAARLVNNRSVLELPSGQDLRLMFRHYLLAHAPQLGEAPSADQSRASGGLSVEAKSVPPAESPSRRSNRSNPSTTPLKDGQRSQALWTKSVATPVTGTSSSKLVKSSATAVKPNTPPPPPPPPTTTTVKPPTPTPTPPPTTTAVNTTNAAMQSLPDVDPSDNESDDDASPHDAKKKYVAKNARLSATGALARGSLQTFFSTYRHPTEADSASARSDHRRGVVPPEFAKHTEGFKLLLSEISSKTTAQGLAFVEAAQRVLQSNLSRCRDLPREDAHAMLMFIYSRGYASVTNRFRTKITGTTAHKCSTVRVRLGCSCGHVCAPLPPGTRKVNNFSRGVGCAFELSLNTATGVIDTSKAFHSCPEPPSGPRAESDPAEFDYEFLTQLFESLGSSITASPGASTNSVLRHLGNSMYSVKYGQTPPVTVMNRRIQEIRRAVGSSIDPGGSTDALVKDIYAGNLGDGALHVDTSFTPHMVSTMVLEPFQWKPESPYAVIQIDASVHVVRENYTMILLSGVGPNLSLKPWIVAFALREDAASYELVMEFARRCSGKHFEENEVILLSDEHKGIAAGVQRQLGDTKVRHVLCFWHRLENAVSSIGKIVSAFVSSRGVVSRDQQDELLRYKDLFPGIDLVKVAKKRKRKHGESSSKDDDDDVGNGSSVPPPKPFIPVEGGDWYDSDDETMCGKARESTLKRIFYMLVDSPTESILRSRFERFKTSVPTLEPYLTYLWPLKHKWARCYTCSVFDLSVRTTSACESIWGSLKGFLGRRNVPVCQIPEGIAKFFVLRTASVGERKLRRLDFKLREFKERLGALSQNLVTVLDQTTTVTCKSIIYEAYCSSSPYTASAVQRLEARSSVESTAAGYYFSQAELKGAFTTLVRVKRIGSEGSSIHYVGVRSCGSFLCDCGATMSMGGLPCRHTMAAFREGLVALDPVHQFNAFWLLPTRHDSTHKPTSVTRGPPTSTGKSSWNSVQAFMTSGGKSPSPQSPPDAVIPPTTDTTPSSASDIDFENFLDQCKALERIPDLSKDIAQKVVDSCQGPMTDADLDVSTEMEDEDGSLSGAVDDRSGNPWSTAVDDLYKIFNKNQPESSRVKVVDWERRIPQMRAGDAMGVKEPDSSIASGERLGTLHRRSNCSFDLEIVWDDGRNNTEFNVDDVRNKSSPVFMMLQASLELFVTSGTSVVPVTRRQQTQLNVAGARHQVVADPMHETKQKKRLKRWNKH